MMDIEQAIQKLDERADKQGEQIAVIYERTNHLTDGQKRIENRIYAIGVAVVIIPILSDFVTRYLVR